MKKLTRAQQEVVELLEKNVLNVVKNVNGCYTVFNMGSSINGNTIARLITKDTFNALIRLNIIKPTDQKDIYVLSEKE